MRNNLIRNTLILLSFIPFIVNGQAPSDSVRSLSYYHIFEGNYVENDSATVLDNWINEGINMMFLSFKDSSIISIDIGGRDKVYFMGMAVRVENPGFETTSNDPEFYHWTFISHIKEGIREAYILKEYVSGSIEKWGEKHYLIHIAFFDESEFVFYGLELKPKLPAPE